LAAVLLFCPLLAAAQTALRFDLGRLDSERVGFGAAQVESSEHGLALGLRLPERSWGSFDLGLDYRYTRHEFENLPSRNRDLHRLALPVTWRSAGETHHALSLIPVFAASSNVFKDPLRRAGSGDFDLHARWETRLPSAGGHWRLGLARDDAFGRTRLYPRLGHVWSSDAWNVDVGWPDAALDWRLKPRLHLGIASAPEGASWQVTSDERAGARFRYAQRVRRSAFTLDWRLSGDLALAGRAGREHGRGIRLEDDLGRALDRRVASGDFVELRLIRRSP
jgi:hypothetical protein